MYKIIVIFLIILSNLSQSQSQVTEIEYEVDLLDAMTGLKPSNPFNPDMVYDWQFNVKFDSNNVRIWRQFTDEFYEERIIDINNNEELLLKKEGDNMYTFYSRMLNMGKSGYLLDRSRYISDTAFTFTDEQKDILGYNCQKVIYERDGETVVTLWITEELNTGVIYPGTPLSFKTVALECRFEQPTLISEFKAIRVEKTTEKIDDTSIPDDYSLVVPRDEFRLTENVIEKETEFEFVHYPRYQDGIDQLHYDIRELCSLKEKPKEGDFDFNFAFIMFTVGKDGALTDITIEGIDDEKEKSRVTKFLQKSKFIPAEVKGEKVNSSVSLSVSLSED